MGWNNVPPNGFPQIPDIEDLESVVKDVTNLKTTTAEQSAAITNLNGTKANKTDIATEFSDLTNYNAGDLVYYEGSLYEFQVDHTAGAWETSEVIQKDLSDIVTTLKSGLNNQISGTIYRYAPVGQNDYIAFALPKGNSYSVPSGAIGFVGVGGVAVPDVTDGSGTDGYVVIASQPVNGIWLCALTGTFATQYRGYTAEATFSVN